jgi:hypothetical protein
MKKAENTAICKSRKESLKEPMVQAPSSWTSILWYYENKLLLSKPPGCRALLQQSQQTMGESCES